MDLREVYVDGYCRDAIVVHCVFKVFKGVENRDLADGNLGPTSMIIYPSSLS